MMAAVVVVEHRVLRIKIIPIAAKICAKWMLITLSMLLLDNANPFAGIIFLKPKALGMKESPRQKRAKTLVDAVRGKAPLGIGKVVLSQVKLVRNNCRNYTLVTRLLTNSVSGILDFPIALHVSLKY